MVDRSMPSGSSAACLAHFHGAKRQLSAQWRAALAQLIAPRLANDDDGTLRAEIISYLTMEVHEAALLWWHDANGMSTS